mgnify:CR=1 FL=1
MASAYLSRTPASASNRDLWTLSFWIKRSTLGTSQSIYGVYADSNNQETLAFDSNDKLYWQLYQSGGVVGQLTTNRLFRDTSAWYHIVVAYDSANSTAGNRMRMYINGVEETSFATDTNPSSGQDSQWNSTTAHTIGRINTTNYFDGSITHFHSIDGTAYTPSAFGQSDSNGVWIPKPSPSVTYGTNGFFLKMDNSGNMGLDSGGGSNNFTTSGTITQAKDTPSNVFATLNPLSSLAILTTGNTTATTTDSTWRPGSTTIGMLGTTGKYYAEFKVISGNNNYVGVYNLNTNFGTSQSTADANRIAYSTYDGEIMRTLTGESTITGLATSGSSDVVGIAINKNDGEVKFYKNGTLIQTVSHSNITNYDLMIGCQVGYTSSSCFNFGNGYFGTTAVTSAGTNASGNGIFEYDVPTGYTALSTKGLNS